MSIAASIDGLALDIPLPQSGPLHKRPDLGRAFVSWTSGQLTRSPPGSQEANFRSDTLCWISRFRSRTSAAESLNRNFPPSKAETFASLPCFFFAEAQLRPIVVVGSKGLAHNRGAYEGHLGTVIPSGAAGSLQPPVTGERFPSSSLFLSLSTRRSGQGQGDYMRCDYFSL